MNRGINFSMWVWLLMLAIPSGLFQMLRVGAPTYLFILGLLVAWSFPSKRLWAFTFSPPILLMAFIAFMYIVSAWANGRIAYSVGTYDAAILLISMPVYFLLGRQLLLISPNKIKWANRALSLILIGLIFTALLGLMQWLGVIPEIDAVPGIGMAWHKNNYGYMCAVALVLVVVRANTKYWSLRICVPLAILLLACLIVSLARGPWAVGFVGLILVQLVYRSRNMMKLMLVLGVVGFLIASVSSDILQRFSQEDVSSGRFDLWAILWPQSWDAFIFGQGTGYMWTLNQYDINQYGGYITEYNEHIYAHNDFLFLLVELGVIAPLLWIVSLILLAKSALQIILTVQRTDPSREFGVILLFVVMSLFVAQMTDTIFFGARNVYLALALLAVCSSVVDYKLTVDAGLKK